MRDETGVWRYGTTGIPAVAAREVTLAQLANPRQIGRSDGEPEAVLLSISEIERNSRLGFAVHEGDRVEIRGEELHYRVAWDIWQEHATEPVDVWLPEDDAAGLDRALAVSEREFRFAKQALEEAGLFRQYLVILAARLGRSRRVVSEAVGLSPARVQQLNESPPRHVPGDVDEFIAVAVRIARSVGDGVKPREALSRPAGIGGDEFEEVVAFMVAAGLLFEESKELGLTADGKALLEIETKGQGKPRSGNGRSKSEQTSHAPQ
ncbi:MAG TPA: hypothetical protein VFJ53_01000 [Solirubrobacterales bacterium]|nr:hypothetical protein [Solirubrobacterales bacterium]